MTLLSKADLSAQIPEINVPDSNIDKIDFCINGKISYNVSTTQTTEVADSSIEEDFNKQLLNTMDFDSLLSGGGTTCRYCVEQCPNN